jgi:hypothetical protein
MNIVTVKGSSPTVNLMQGDIFTDDDGNYYILARLDSYDEDNDDQYALINLSTGETADPMKESIAMTVRSYRKVFVGVSITLEIRERS